MSRLVIEDVYPLSPVQIGLLAQELLEPGSGYHVVQFVATLSGPLDVAAFRRCWETVERRHTALRSAFVWDGLKEPLQVVQKQPALQFEVANIGPGGTEELIARVRARGFRLDRAPLWSVMLARVHELKHVCVWTYHHLLLDGWSSGIVLSEVFGEYEAAMKNTPSPAAAVAPYHRYLSWLKRQDAGDAEDFWRRELAGLRPAKAPQSATKGQPATALVAIQGDLGQAVNSFTRALGITIGTLVHGLWAALLARRSGAREVTIGSVVSGRAAELEGAESIVGSLINVLPLRVAIDPEQNTEDWLRQLQSTLLKIQKYGAVSQGQLASLAGLSDGARLFDTIVTLENYPDAIWRRAGLNRLDICDVRFVESTAYPLCLEAVPAENLVLQVLYDANGFPRDSITRLLEEAQLVLRKLVKDGTSNVGQLLHRTHILAIPGAVPPKQDTLASRWISGAAVHAASTAVECGAASLTYAELNGLALEIAERLREAGAGPEEIVAVVIDRSIEMVAGILGVILAGAAYLPLDPSLPEERIDLLLRDAGARFAVAGRALSARMEGYAIHCVVVDAASRHILRRALDPSCVRPDNAAYVIYTSGSTGSPKGVVVTHRNVTHLLDATQPALGFGPQDAWTLFHSCGFDFSVWELFGSLLSGGRLVVVPGPVTRSPADFARLLADRQITVLNQTPSAFRVLLTDGLPVLAGRSLALRWIVFGGEALQFAVLQGWFRRDAATGVNGTRVLNMYGITETTVHVTWRSLDAVDAALATASCIGEPIPGMRVHLLDSNGTPVPLGQPGEICVGGAGLSRGYLRAPALTASRFVPDPFAEIPGQRLYRSGDLARRLANGDLEYLGRIDRQLKSRGYRIEPGEIEAALRTHAGVHDALVIPNDSGEGSGIAAYVIPSEAEAGPVKRLLAANGPAANLPVCELPSGFAVCHRNRTETRFMHHEIFESCCYFRGGVELGDGDVVFDVGANIGLFSLACHLRSTGVRVYAFEPLPESYRVLEANFAVHGIEGSAFNCGMDAHAGEVELEYYPHATVLSGRSGNSALQTELVRAMVRTAVGEDGQVLEEVMANRLASRPVACRMATVSEMLRRLNLEAVGLLKIDVEGSESRVLEGIADSDWERIRQLAIEVHGADVLAQIERSMSTRGYRVTIEQEEELRGSDLFMLYATGHQAQPLARRQTRKHDQWRSPERLVEDIHRQLRHKIPEHMQPRVVHLIDRLPLTSNGKVDMATLRAGCAGVAEELDGEPRTPTERILLRVWEEVLRTRIPGTHTSFFELGGDSIVCIRMISRARQEGLNFTPADVFERRTIAALALASKPAPARTASTETPAGPVALTPIQEWFFQIETTNLNHWNQAVLVELTKTVVPAVLRDALNAVAQHHDALRIQFHHGVDGWSQVPARTVEVPLECYPQADEQRAMRETHAGLDLSQGRLMRAALIDNDEGAQRLLLVVHHLAIDAVSWRIVLEDLVTAASSIVDGRPVRLPAVECSWMQWAAQAIPSPEQTSNSTVANAEGCSLPRDFDPGQPLTEASTRDVRVSLSTQETAVLLEPARHRGPEQILLAACMYAMAQRTSSSRVSIVVEGHGREPASALDPSRTVGWFTRFRRVTVQIPDSTDPASLLLCVREASSKPTMPKQDDVCFNYLGNLGWQAGTEPVRLVSATAGVLHAPEGIRPFLIGIESAIANEELTFTLSYSDRAHRRESIEALGTEIIRATRVLVQHLRSKRKHADAYPLAELNDAELTQLLAAAPDAEEIYRLTPSQQGILFHALHHPESSIYLSQFYWSMEGELDTDAFRQAWRQTVSRHSVLRTSLVLQSLRHPHQIVHRASEWAIEEHDWRDRSQDSLEELWGKFLFQERSRPLDWTRAPVMRCALVRTLEREYRVAWSHHHALLDGWSTGIILRDVFMAYDSLRRGVVKEGFFPAISHPYREYVAWLERQPREQARAFWSGRLKGAAAVILPDLGPGEADSGDSRVGMTLAEDRHAALEATVHTYHLTWNTLVMGAWAIVVSSLAGNEDVLFGSVVAGRPLELAGAEEMVGLFINTLPVRTRVSGSRNIVGWLQQLQREHLDARSFEHSSLMEIRRWMGLAGSQPLFETAVVFENLPETSMVPSSAAGLTVRNVGSFVRNHFLFTVRGIPGPRLRVEALFDPARVARSRAKQLLELLANVLGVIADHPDDVVGRLVFASGSFNKRVQAMSQSVPEISSQRRRVAVSADPRNFVRLTPSASLPLLVEPAFDDLNLAAWLRSQAAWVDGLLVEHKALRFRGFRCDSAESLEAAMSAVGRSPFDYSYASTPRKHVQGRVFTSTEYPADQIIPMHNEMSYTRQWPARLWFACVTPASQGGTTPLADSARVWRRISEPVRARFREHGVMYTRSFEPGIDLNWRDVFHTDSRTEVEECCRNAGIEWAWLGTERLRTRQICQSEVVHPATGETVWFNQAHLFHSSNLPETIRSVMESTLSPEERPRNACFGDGSSIPVAMLEEVRAAYACETREFTWEKGDVLLVDNVATAHGRTPFLGSRQILVGMSA